MLIAHLDNVITQQASSRAVGRRSRQANQRGVY